MAAHLLGKNNNWDSSVLCGLLEFEVQTLGHLPEICQKAEKQADIYAYNCSIDTDEATNNPVLAQLIQSLPL